MKLLFTVHEIRSGAKTIEPRTVDEFSDDDAASLLAVGAAREPNEAEIALYRLGHPEAVTEKKGGKGSKTVAAPVVEPTTAPVDESQDL